MDGSCGVEFGNTFMVQKSITEKFQEMQQRHQQSNENTKEYFFDKIRLCKALFFDIKETKTQFAVGLWSREISTAIMSKSYSNTDQLLKSIMELESLEAARKNELEAGENC